MRYLSWLGGIVTGDLGVSLASKREISELVGIRIANTLFLGGFAAAIAVPLALFLGILAALYRNTLYDRAINTFTLTTISFPEFFVAYILILFFAIKLGWFPGISNISTELSFGNKLTRP
jgi:peptide/nickel transport system permease protein